MFSAFFIRRPRFAIVISLFFLLAGGLSALRLPVAEYPEVAPPTIMVFTNYPGASAQIIADTVAAPLEAEINGVEDMIYYTSTSDNSGNYMLILTFESHADEDMALVNVNNAVKRAERSLPNEVVDNGLTVIKRSSDITAVFAFTSQNPDHSPLFLSNYVSNNIRDEITRIDGVGQAQIFGEQKYSMRVWLDPPRMQALDIGYAEVAAAIARQNVQAATGAVGTESASDYMQFKVDARGRLVEAEEFAAIVVRSGEDGRQVRLADIARVELGAESYAGVGRVNGSPATVMAVFKRSAANAVALVDITKARIAELAENFPEGMEWTVAYDTTEFVRVTMREIIETLVLTFLLVVLITYVFLQDWRATLVPAAAIPVSLVGTFLFMRLFGMSINTLSMFGLILVIGSVVDDAICVVESCARMIHEEGLSPRAAAFKTMEQLTGALVATTLVVVAIYAPIGFAGGMVGNIYAQFAVTMCIALCLSTVNALTLSPALCALVLRDVGEPRGLFKVFNKTLEAARGGYLAIGGLLARRTVLTAILFAGVIYGNYHLYNKLPGAFLPGEDKGALLGEVVLPSGASLPRTEAAIARIVDIALGMDGVERIISIPGFSLTSGNGENVGFVILALEHWDKRATPEKTVESIQRRFLEACAALPDATVTAFVPPAISGLGATGGVSFALQATGGQSALELAQGANHLISKIMESGKAQYAFTSFDASTPMLELKLDRAKAEAMGVPVDSVFNTLQTQLGSIYVNDFNMLGKTYKVKVQSEAAFRENPNVLGQFRIAGNNGVSVPLDSLATLEWTRGPRQSERFNMFPSANVRTQSLPGTSSGDMMSLVRDLVRDELGGDYRIGWTDMSFQESRNEGQILGLMALAIVFAYLFLVAQYESWNMPVSVMLSVATATLGGLYALQCYGQSLNIYCQLGLLMLVGLTAKTAILMVEFSKQERDGGMPVVEAALTGMRVRFRAVLMTALSFVIGVAPMVLASGAGAGSRKAIGQTTFWGMLVATVAGMMFIPGLYVIFERLAETSSRAFAFVFGGKRAAPPQTAAAPSDKPSTNE